MTSLKMIFRTWMRFAHFINAVMTRLLLMLAYCLVFVPLGLLRRMFGSDPLDREKQPGAPTYWRSREKPSALTDPF